MNANRIMVVIAIGLMLVIGLQIALLRQHQHSDELDSAPHPIVGTWTVQLDPERSPHIMSFAPAGTAQYLSGATATGLGAWEATGPQSALITFLIRDPGVDAAVREWMVIRAVVQVTDDLAFAGTYTVELRAAGNSQSSGQIGPGAAAGQRITAEAVGSPVVPLDVLPPAPVVTPTTAAR